MVERRGGGIGRAWYCRCEKGFYQCVLDVPHAREGELGVLGAEGRAAGYLGLGVLEGKSAMVISYETASESPWESLLAKDRRVGLSHIRSKRAGRPRSLGYAVASVAFLTSCACVGCGKFLEGEGGLKIGFGRQTACISWRLICFSLAPWGQGSGPGRHWGLVSSRCQCPR